MTLIATRDMSDTLKLGGPSLGKRGNNGGDALHKNSRVNKRIDCITASQSAGFVSFFFLLFFFFLLHLPICLHRDC